MKVADTGSFMTVSSQSGIQVANKQTSIENGYNVFDEIAGRLDSSVWALSSWMKKLDSRLESATQIACKLQ